MATFDELLSGITGDDFSNFTEQLESFGLPRQLFRPEQASSFREQAETETGSFFDKNLDLALKNIQIVEDQAKARKAQTEAFQAEQEKQFFRTEDKGFARALDQAQGRFSGRGLGQSGIRRGEIDNLFEGRSEDLEKAQRGFRQATETRDLGFEQLQERGDLTEESERLRVDRGRESEILGRQQQLASQSESQRRAALGALSGSFSEFLQGINT